MPLNEFGTTAWGRAWLRLAEPVTITRPDPQLPRARSLARGDRVTDLRTEPGRVRATVHDGGQYDVEITLPAWDDEERAVAGARLAGAGPDLPDEVADGLAADGLAIAPQPDQLHASCSCRRRDRRCRHVLATLIELARRADETPAVALRLRGLDPPADAPDRDRLRIADLDPRTFWTDGAR